MKKYVIDTYAWIEYFLGTDKGRIVSKIIEDPCNESFSSMLTVAELSRFFQRKNLPFALVRKKVESLGKIIPFTIDFADELGRISYQISQTRKHMGMADVSVYLVAKKLNAKIVTGDQDFKGLPND
jgi:predicted nucleic acid-binding protein